MKKLIESTKEATVKFGRWWTNVEVGIGNLISWAPLIWNDRDWDWAYLADMMAKKARQMAHHHERLISTPPETADQLRQLAGDLDFVMADDMDHINFNGPDATREMTRHELDMAGRWDRIGKNIADNMKRWWD